MCAVFPKHPFAQFALAASVLAPQWSISILSDLKNLTAHRFCFGNRFRLKSEGVFGCFRVSDRTRAKSICDQKTDSSGFSLKRSGPQHDSESRSSSFRGWTGGCRCAWSCDSGCAVRFLIEVLPDAQVVQASMSDETYYFPFLAMCIGYAIRFS